MQRGRLAADDPRAGAAAGRPTRPYVKHQGGTQQLPTLTAVRDDVPMDDAAPPGEPETLAVRRLHNAIAEADSALGKRLRLNATDLAAMAHLTWSSEPVGPGELANFLNLSAAAGTSVVDRLTSAGQVERHRDLADRRRVRLQPSDRAAAAVLAQVAPLVHEMNTLAQGLSAADRKVVLRFLAQVTEIYVRWTAGPDSGSPLDGAA